MAIDPIVLNCGLFLATLPVTRQRVGRNILLLAEFSQPQSARLIFSYQFPNFIAGPIVAQSCRGSLLYHVLSSADSSLLQDVLALTLTLDRQISLSDKSHGRSGLIDKDTAHLASGNREEMHAVIWLYCSTGK